MRRERTVGKRIWLWGWLAVLLLVVLVGSVWAEDSGFFSGFSLEDFGFGDLFKELFGSEGEQQGEAAQAEPEAPLTPEEQKAVDKGLTRHYRVKAETDTLVLWFDETTSNLAVEDKRNGFMWRSAPDIDTSQLQISSLWIDHLQSPFIFTWTQDFERTRTGNTKQAAPEMTFEPVEGGVKVHYKFTGSGEGIQLSIIYRIVGDELVVSIPYQDFKEDKEKSNFLVSLEMLPFLGAATDNDPGYAFYPDGSGAITRFEPVHAPEYTRGYSEFVYGPEDFPWPGRPQVAQTAMLPVFGMVRGDAAFLGIITQGEASAKINFSPSGHIVGLYRTDAELVYRRNYQAMLRRWTPVEKFAEDPIKGDREVRYIFLDKANASYSGMAMRYRRYLIEEAGVKPVTLTEYPLHLRLFMGIQKPMLVFKQFVAMTTFEQANTIVRDLMDNRGVKGIDLTLVGWNRGGWFGNWPRRLPIPSQLGGASGLKTLTTEMKRRNVPVYLEDNYIEAYREAGGFAPRVDVVRGVNKLPIYDPRDNDHLLLSPMVALRQAKRDIPELAKTGVSGEEFVYFGETMFPDYNARSLPKGQTVLERDETADTWMQIVETSRQLLGRAAAHGANAYLFGHVDALRDLPMRDSGYVFADEAVPFMQMVLHGLIPYSGETANLRYDRRRQFLRQIEYGAIPVFELTWKSSVELEPTEYNRLFSSEYRLWADRAAKEYAEMARIFAPLMNQAMVKHEQLAPKVFRTTYEDGTSIVVNYNETPWDQGGIHVDALGYTVIPGGKAR